MDLHGVRLRDHVICAFGFDPAIILGDLMKRILADLNGDAREVEIADYHP